MDKDNISCIDFTGKEETFIKYKSNNDYKANKRNNKPSKLKIGTIGLNSIVKPNK